MEIVNEWLLHTLLFVLGGVLGGNATLLSLWRLKLLSWSSRAELEVLNQENAKLRAERTKAQEELYAFIQKFLLRITGDE